MALVHVQVHDVEKNVERLTLSTSNVHTQESKGQLLLLPGVCINNCALQFIHVGDTDVTHGTTCKSDGGLATTAEHKLEGDSYCMF